MPEPPHRKRFQIHLSTAIVLMFVAGVLIWANVRDRSNARLLLPTAYLKDHVGNHGWPLIAVDRTVTWSPAVPPAERSPYRDFIPITTFNYKCLAADILIALLILVALYIFLERLIRRRALRKDA